jgi:uncharacterized protein
VIAALLITLASVLIGAVLAALLARDSALLGALRTFAVAAVATLVVVQLLPEAVEGIGGLGLLLFVAGILVPPLFAWMSRRIVRPGGKVTAGGVGMELGYLGFVAHQFVEGLALGTYSGPQHLDHDHADLVLAVAAHTVPLTALFIGAVLKRRGRRPAMRRLIALVLATGLGFAAAGWVHLGVAETVTPVLGALVAGFLCHVLVHKPDAEPPRTGIFRWIDVAAVALGVALPLSASHSHGFAGVDVDLRHRLWESWVELALETAPMLLLGLVLGALLQVIGSRIPTRWLTTGSASRQAVRGIAVGAPLPLCACGVLPIAEGLRARGAGPALVVAFLISTPELGPEAFTLSVRFLGWPFAIVRIVAALLVAYVAGVVFAHLVGGAPSSAGTSAGAKPIVEHVARKGRAIGTAWQAFDELLLHTAPWTVIGLLAAAYIEVVFPAEALAPLAKYGLDIVVIALVAMPMYVCAASTTPMAAVLIAKGVSPGAVLVGMLLGPATNVATVGVLGRAYGARATFGGVVAILVVACGIGVVINAVGVPVVLPVGIEATHEHGAWAFAACALIGGALAVQLWRFGIAGWLGVLDAGHSHDHAHGHDHGHDHDHGHASRG